MRFPPLRRAQTNVLCFNNDINLLAIGMESGKVTLCRLPANFEIVRGDTYESNELKAHTKRVAGMTIQKDFGYLYTAGGDGKYRISDINSSESVWGM